MCQMILFNLFDTNFVLHGTIFNPNDTDFNQHDTNDALQTIKNERVRIFHCNTKQKTTLAGGFCFGGEGEIRTLEPSYRLHDFQSCALDQLGDFSLLLFASLYIVPHIFTKIKDKNKKNIFFLKIIKNHYKKVYFHVILY